MQVKILGCSGGIGGNLRTTSMLVDDDILIDAGTGVGDLSIDQLVKINHVFLTHSHLDHIALLPLLLDTVLGMRLQPIIVHASSETIKTLKEHIFNWKVWPDFNAIPNTENPLLQYSELSLGASLTINGRHITSLPANHVIHAVGYRIDSGKESLVFTGDTTECDALWTAVNEIPNLKYLIIETAFSNKELELAMLSKHLCPSMLMSELAKLEHNPKIYITHLKPGEGELIMHEIEQNPLSLRLRALQNSQIFIL